MLGSLIEILKTAHPARMVPIGWNGAFSYRGDYAQLGVQRAKNVFVGDMLKILEQALGRTYHGYKGGEYVMSEYVDVYLVESASECGEQIGPTFLKMMIGLVPETGAKHD